MHTRRVHLSTQQGAKVFRGKIYSRIVFVLKTERRDHSANCLVDMLKFLLNLQHTVWTDFRHVDGAILADHQRMRVLNAL